MRGILAFLIGSLVLAVSLPADATESRPSRHRREREHRPSVSVGYANSGRLRNASRLDEDDTIRHLPGRALHYGTDELVGLVRRAARTVFRRHNVRLTVGDLSAAGGGPALHHASHQSGRDVDIAFFAIDSHGRPATINDYVSFGRGGRPLVTGDLRFDTRRNWALLHALLTDPAVHVERVFVSRPLRAVLLAHAQAIHADAALIDEAANVMLQPTSGSPHANHFHVRIGCPGGDPTCVAGIHAPPRRRRHGRALARADRRHHGSHRETAVSAHDRPAPRLRPERTARDAHR